MTEAHLVAKKLALVETYVTELRTLARLDRVAHDVRERRFVEHTHPRSSQPFVSASDVETRTG